MNESPPHSPSAPTADERPSPGLPSSAPEPPPQTAGDVVNEGHESEELQKKISDLEKKHGDEKKRADDLENKISQTRKVRSARDPEKSLLDELNDFWEGK